MKIRYIDKFNFYINKQKILESGIKPILPSLPTARAKSGSVKGLVIKLILIGKMESHRIQL